MASYLTKIKVGTLNKVDEWLEQILEEGKMIVEKEITGMKVTDEFYVVNTVKGRKKYHNVTGEPPIINASVWDEMYGHVETIEGIHFIFLNNILVQNFVWGDSLATIVHEILHAIFPQATEEEIKEMEDYSSRVNKIQREWILGKL